jgi:hypothetical protein
MSSALAEVSRAKRAIQAATTSEDANEIRARLKAIQKYLRKRQQDYGTAFEAAKLECEAAAKAGQLWAADRPGSGGDHQTKTFLFGDAGFASTMDATICVRLGDLDPQDVVIYCEEMRDKHRYPTEGGLYVLWHRLNGTEDDERPWLRFYQVWNFPFADPDYGQSHPGMIPAQVMMNLNYYYTSPGDLVVDLFAGGGSTLDVCKADNEDFGKRKCMAFDITPVRTDVKKWDVTRGLPHFPHARMLFLDPPYWKQKQGEYSDDETNFANMPLDRFNAELEAVVVSGMQQADLVALIIGPTQQDWEITDHAAEMIHRVGVPWKRIQVPYSTQQHGGDYVTKAKAAKQWLYLARDLMIWRGTAIPTAV